MVFAFLVDLEEEPLRLVGVRSSVEHNDYISDLLGLEGEPCLPRKKDA